MGDIYRDWKGYPRYSDSGRLVHRDVARNMIGGEIGRGRVVHHVDGDKSNFRRNNLRVMDRSSHSSYHAQKRRR